MMNFKLSLLMLSLFFLLTSCSYNDDAQTAKLRKYASTNYLDGGLDEPTSDARPVFNTLIKSLMKLGQDAPLESKMVPLERCVLELNKIYTIETVERDIFMGAVEDIGLIVGLDQPSFDRLQKLRDF